MGCAQTSLFAQFNEQPFPGQQGFGTGTNQMGANGDRTNGSQQRNQKDSTKLNTESIDPKLYMWKIDQRFGNIRLADVDTLHHQFQNTNFVDGMNGHKNYLGNLGSPSWSRNYFERPDLSKNLFIDPFSSVYSTPEDFYFANSRLPYTNLTYYKAGSTIDGEDRLKGYFSVNVNKRLAFGFNLDYQYGRGIYISQSTAHFNGSLFGSYLGDKYQAHFLYNNFSIKMAENGGIIDDRYITDPLAMSEGKRKYSPIEIKSNLTNTWNRNKDYYLFYTHRYNLGFKKEVVKKVVEKSKDEKTNTNGKDKKKEKEYEFVPVTSFIHTIKIENSRRRFISFNEPKQLKNPNETVTAKQEWVSSLYDNTYINTKEFASNDTTKFSSIKNTFAIALVEGFNKYAKAGLKGFISHENNKYTLMSKTTTSDIYSENEVYAGGELSKRAGNLLHYTATGEVGIIKEAIGQFRFNGNMDLNFRLFKDTISLIASANISNTLPSFYMRHYHSNHFWWDNNLDKEFKTRLEGEFTSQRWKTNLKVSVENIKNYTYFGSKATPTQHTGNIQILAAMLKQNFQLGKIHLDNEITYQKSGNNSVIPLPELSLYHNLYIATKISKKVLSVELGADVRYFTKYNALAYTPAIGNFNLQDNAKSVQIGGYPIVNAYANLHLKRTRFFVMFYHVNQGSGGGNAFYVPHYPINPRTFKIGISWNFYD